MLHSSENAESSAPGSGGDTILYKGMLIVPSVNKLLRHFTVPVDAGTSQFLVRGMLGLSSINFIVRKLL